MKDESSILLFLTLTQIHDKLFICVNSKRKQDRKRKTKRI